LTFLAFSSPAFFLVPHFHVSHFQSPLGKVRLVFYVSSNSGLLRVQVNLQRGPSGGRTKEFQVNFCTSLLQMK